MLGVTPLPDRIEFRCRKCGKSLGVSRDPALLRKRSMPDAPTAPTETKTETKTEQAPDAAKTEQEPRT